MFCILGQDLEIADEETVKKKSDSAIRARGPIEVELTGDWLQSRAMATDVADWMTEHWSQGLDELDVEIFGNPLLEIADVVDITYAHQNMTAATHQYFVTGISNSFETGLTTSLTLRRVNRATDVS